MIEPKTVIATGNVVLHDAQALTVGRWLVSFVRTGGTFTVKPQKRIHPTNGATGQPFQDCWYTLALSNTPVVEGVTQNTDVILDIDASGCDVQLAFVISGGASVVVHATPLAG